MELRIQPKPEVNFLPADKGIVSRKEFFVKKHLEELKKNTFPALFIRHWRAKAELVYPSHPDTSSIQYECYFNRNIQNYFAEDFAEEAFLRTPPPCFVVFGKRGKCSAELSKKLAEDYGSILLNLDDVVDQVLGMRTQTSKVLDQILRLGVPLTLNFVLALLCYMAHTQEARHRGYVLCGLPTLAFLQDMPVEQQFNYLFTWDNKPTIFVYVLYEDEDLVNERASMKYEVRSSGKESSIFSHFEFKDVTADNDEPADSHGIPIKQEPPFEPDIDISPSRPRIQLPRDEESRVWTELELFDAMIRPVIDLIVSRLDPQCLVVVDSRLKNAYDIIKTQVDLLPVWKSPIPMPFISPHEHKILTQRESAEHEIDGELSERASSYDDDILRVAVLPPQIAFLTLFAKKTLSPKFRWELSHYNYICPVSLREGEVVEGKSKFAVAFLKYIYFLRDQDCVTKFLRNPRAYVLPVKPRPLCRFFILGYPYSGKTTLAKTLAAEFSIPLINVDEVLRSDAERKKSSYQDFCRQKAECREIIRLTALAWQDWRLEEERRVNLIEECILYLQTLLQKRIDQFYSSGVGSSMTSEKSEPFVGSIQRDSDNASRGALRERKSGMKKKYLHSPSAELIESMKEGRSTFNKEEANSYFSFVWRSFSEKSRSHYGESGSEAEYRGETYFGDEEDSEDDTHSVNWCDLLPPQSLSSFLIAKLPYTTRVKRESFKIFLEAASKAYHNPSKLKSEFAKWHLPCYMDIPLCGVLLENPIFLLKYVPVWLRERPLIPIPVDPSHPAVLAEGDKAFKKASMVIVRQNEEEQGILLRTAIEKAEREGMRVTGEVITPGGWVVDNMTLDPAVWKKLLCERVFADHVYILVDSELGNRRIISYWWEMYGRDVCSRSSLNITETEGENQRMESVSSEPTLTETDESSQIYLDKTILASLLEEWVAANANGDKQLDEIFERLKPDIQNIKYFFPPFPVDPFCHSLFQNTKDNWNDLKDDALHEETTYIIQTLTGLVSRTLFWSREQMSSITRIPLGSQLETCANALVDFYNTKPLDEEIIEGIKQSVFGCLDFFKYLHTLPQKLEALKEVFHEAGRGETIEEMEINGKTPEAVFNEFLDRLMSPFIKKPRELEEFEIEEIKASTDVGTSRLYDEEEGELEYEESETVERGSTQGEEREDIRIFGESGELCIVSLERNKYLVGKLEYSLRYLGKLYYFWSQDCKDKFIADPEKYAPYYSAIRCYPPMRIYVVGPTGSGRTTLTSAIGHQCQMGSIDFLKFLSKRVLPFSKPTAEKWDIVSNYKLLLAENHNEPAKQLKEKFMRFPYGKRQFWLEHCFHTSYEDNKEMYDLLHKISINPVNFGEFPELKYACVESVFDTYGDDYMEMHPKVTDLPETPFMSMKEMAVVFESDALLESDKTNAWREKSVDVLWNQQPYIQNGFILKGYPRKLQDVKHIVDKTWVPDLVIEMVLPEAAIINRNVDVLLEQWQAKLKKEVAEQEALELALTTIQSNCREIRQKELYLERQKMLLTMNSRRFGSVESSSEVSERLSKPTLKSITKRHRLTQELDEEAYYAAKIPEGVKEEVEKILDQEFPNLIFRPVFETYFTAKERIINHLLRNCRKDLAELSKIKPILNELNIPWLTVDGLKPTRENQLGLFLKLEKIRSRSGQKKEFAFCVSMEMAEKLLEQGYYFLSKFGRMCPVQAFLMKNPLHMYTALNAKGKITPIVYRSYLYFVGGDGEKTKFLSNPLRYVNNYSYRINIPLRVAVIGPPKCGKSTLCKRLAVMFDLRVVTMGMALRMALEETPNSTLAKAINGYLRRGCFLPLSLKVEALVMCLTHPSSGTQGYVLDGVPFDAALTQSLAERYKLPYLIISLVVDSHFMKTNQERLNPKDFRIPHKQRINLDTRYKDWLETYNRFAKWNQDTFNNIYELNAKLNSVDVFYQAFDIIKEAFLSIMHYCKYCMSNKALSLKYLCVGHQEYLSKRSLCGNNCPVCWAEVNRLNYCTETRPKSGLVQYLNYIYWICPDHMQKFLKNPKSYLPPKTPKWPELLPERVYSTPEGRNSLLKLVHGHGRCPVTRVDFPSSLEWEGSWDFAASYDGEIFLCKNEKMIQRFLAQPWRYCKADTIFESQRVQKSNAVVNLSPPKITSLPPIGFLEQTVAELIHEGLQIVGSLRPLYPNMHPRVTGCIFIALFLKMHNKKKKYCYLDRECFDFFVRHCQAARYRVTLFRPPDTSMGQDEIEPDVSDYTDTSSFDESGRSGDYFTRNWLDFETQATKRMWSAKNVDKNYVEMKLTDKNELLEIPEVPAAVAILRFQHHSLRPPPLPPIDDCLNFIYSIPTKMQLPEKFNYNSLHLLPSSFSSPFTPKILFNPHKQFSQSLFRRDDPGFPSFTNLHHEKRVLSDCSLNETKPKELSEPNKDLMSKGFFPRFQLLDKVTPENTPSPPLVVEKEPLALNPHFDHSYMMLYSEFFHTTHYIRCYDLDETHRYKEILNRFDKYLNMTATQVEYIFPPRKTASMGSRTSVDSYQQIFDAVTPFLITTPTIKMSEIFNFGKHDSSKGSINEFLEAITEKYDGSLAQVSSAESYDSFEINVVPTNSDVSQWSEVIIQEILAYPPLPWDIISRPYYAYCSIPSIFEKPHLDHIAHERHVSLLDGITELNEEFRFVPFPTSVQLKFNSEATAQANRRRNQTPQCHFYFDFFNMPWTSFLTYRHKWTYATDMTDRPADKGLAKAGSELIDKPPNDKGPNNPVEDNTQGGQRGVF